MKHASLMRLVAATAACLLTACSADSGEAENTTGSPEGELVLARPRSSCNGHTIQSLIDAAQPGTLTSQQMDYLNVHYHNLYRLAVVSNPIRTGQAKFIGRSAVKDCENLFPGTLPYVMFVPIDPNRFQYEICKVKGECSGQRTYQQELESAPAAAMLTVIFPVTTLPGQSWWLGFDPQHPS